MLSLEERILSELLLAERGVTPELIEDCVQAASTRPPGSLPAILVQQGALAPEVVRAAVERARAIAEGLAPTLADGARLGPFRLIREIGRGGMGIVYEAEQEPLGRRVALKVLATAQANEADAVRFLREASAVARLDHPGLIRVFSSGQAEGLLYFAMELVDGESLAERVRSGPLTPRDAARIGAELARALAHAHGHGLVHRDVKPGNILIDADGNTRLVDFGLVHDAGAASLTLTGAALGTPAFMAPEQARGEAVGTASDIYGVGAVLYFLLTGRPPYTGEVTSAVLGRLLTGPPVRVRAVRPEIPRPLARIVERAMDRRPERRYPTATALAEDLERRTHTDDRRWLGGGRMVRLAVVAAATGLAVTAVFAVRARRPPAAPNIAAWSLSFLGAPLHVFPDPALPKYEPTLSPDGTLFASADNTDSLAHPVVNLRQIGTLVPNGASSQSFGDDAIAALQPLFAANGRELAFLSGTMRVLDLASRQITDLGFEGYPDWWSTDGFKIGFVSAPPDSQGTRWAYAVLRPLRPALLDRRTGTVEALPEVVGDSLHWSPDGALLSYLAGERGDRVDVWTRPARGGPAIQVTSSPGGKWNLAWSPDGRYLYYSDLGAAHASLLRVAVDSATGQARGRPESVGLDYLVSSVALAFARDTGRVAMLSSQSLDRLVRIDLDAAGNVVSVFDRFENLGLHYVRAADVAPDGRRIVFTSTKDGTLQVAQFDDLGVARLSEPDFPCESARWSPDGSRIAFHAPGDGGRLQIWSMAADGTALVSYGEMPPGDATDPAWSPDGRRLAFTVLGDGGYLLDLPVDAKPVRLPSFGAGGFAPSSWSPDGSQLAGTADGIVVYDIAASRYRRLTSQGARPVWLDDRRLVFVDDGALYVIDRDGGPPRAILRAAPFQLRPFLDVAGGGRQVYCTVASSNGDVIVFEPPSASASAVEDPGKE